MIQVTGSLPPTCEIRDSVYQSQLEPGTTLAIVGIQEVNQNRIARSLVLSLLSFSLLLCFLNDFFLKKEILNFGLRTTTKR